MTPEHRLSNEIRIECGTRNWLCFHINVAKIRMSDGSYFNTGVLWGLILYNRDIQVVGIQVGANPSKRLNKYAPPNYLRNTQIIRSDYDYSTPAKVTKLFDIELDEIYEAKCIPFVQPDDLFWIVGVGLRK